MTLSLVTFSCDSNSGSGGGSGTPTLPEDPDLTTVTHREIVSMAAEAGTDANGFLTDKDGNPYKQATDTGVNDYFVHNITPFEIGQYEVTYELWYTVRIWAEANGYTFANLGREGSTGTNGAVPTPAGKLEPVTMVNWRDAIVWCNAYSERTGLTPCYYTDNTLGTVLKISSNNTTISAANGDIASDCVDWTANGYRLPTEGEWQYAASCAATYPYNYASGADATYSATNGGSDIDGDGDVEYSGDVAWYSSNSGGKTQPAGTRSGNRYGLHDLSGNVWEWCWDGYATNPTSMQVDYRASGSLRVFRGGCWDDYASYLRLGGRDYYGPYHEDYGIGFRVVRHP